MKEPSLGGAASVDDEHSVPSSPDEADANDNTNQRRESGTVSPSPAPAASSDDAAIPLASTAIGNAIVGNTALQFNNTNANLARMLESVESMMNSNDVEHNMTYPTRSRSVSGSQPPPMVLASAAAPKPSIAAVNISPILSAMDLDSDTNMKQPPLVTSAFVEATTSTSPLPDAQQSYSSYDHEVVDPGEGAWNETSLQVSSLRDSFVSHLPTGGSHFSGAIPGAAYFPSATSNTTMAMAMQETSTAVLPGLEEHEALLSSKNAFPLNLTRMLESVVPMRMAHIVSWSKDEKSFVIYDVDTFLVEVLPKFFPASENTKIRSFYRKLNRWKFSMSRKNNANPQPIWRHPDPNFNRMNAVRALKASLQSGLVVNFLNLHCSPSAQAEEDAEDQDSLSYWSNDSSVSIGMTQTIKRSSMPSSLHRSALKRSPTFEEIPSQRSRGKLSRSFNKAASLTFEGIPSKQRSRGKHSLSLDLGSRPKQAWATRTSANATFDQVPWITSSNSRIGPSPNIFSLSNQETLTYQSRAPNIFAASAQQNDMLPQAPYSNMFATSATSALERLTRTTSHGTPITANTAMFPPPPQPIAATSSEISVNERRLLEELNLTTTQEDDDLDLTAFLEGFDTSFTSPPPE